MYAVASLVRKWVGVDADAMWERLAAVCNLTDSRNTPAPHFSWQAASAYDLQASKKVLASISEAARSFSVQTAGIGIFTGEQPILYLALVKTTKLLELHYSIWERLQPYAIDANTRYVPELWVPHITLAHQALTRPGLECLLQRLIYQPLEFTLVVENIALLSQSDGDAGVVAEYDFQAANGKETEGR